MAVKMDISDFDSHALQDFRKFLCDALDLL